MRFNRDQGGLERLADHTVAARDRLGEPVLAACPFSHRGLLANKAAGKFGLLAYMASKQVNKQQAAGLPDRFVLAITADAIVALHDRARMSTTPKLGDEVGRWRRGELGVGVGRGITPYQLDVVLRPAGGDPIKCCVGDTTVADAFLALLATPAAVA